MNSKENKAPLELVREYSKHVANHLNISGQKLFKGTLMKIEKALINDCLRVLKVSWKFHIPTIHSFVVIYLWNLLFS